jgi:hypothetical protein
MAPDNAGAASGSLKLLSRCCCCFLRQNRFDVAVRASDHVDANDFAFDGFNRLRTGVGGGFDCGDIADDHGRDERVADLGHWACEFNIRSLEHCVGALDKGDEAAGFQESYCLMSHVFSFLVSD